MSENPVNANDVLPNKHLTFMLNNQLYGIIVASVIEIIGIQKITPVPEFPVYAKGIINLRGIIIPVVDMNIRFGYDAVPYTERTCIIVVNISEMFMGFIVDTVDEVIDILPESINMPPNNSNQDMKFVNGIVETQNGVVLLISEEAITETSDINMQA